MLLDHLEGVVSTPMDVVGIALPFLPKHAHNIASALE